MEDELDAGFSGGESDCYSDDDGICSGNGQEIEVEQDDEPVYVVIDYFHISICNVALCISPIYQFGVISCVNY